MKILANLKQCAQVIFNLCIKTVVWNWCCKTFVWNWCCKTFVWNWCCKTFVWKWCCKTFVWKWCCKTFVWKWCCKTFVWKWLMPTRYILDTVQIICNIVVGLKNPLQGWYLVVGVIIMGGSGVWLSWVKNSFVVNDDVIKATLLFILTIVGTAVFDLMYSFFTKSDGNKESPQFSYYLELITLAIFISLFASYFYYRFNLINGKLVMHYLLPISLCYWLAVNAKDRKFTPSLSPGENPSGGPTDPPLRPVTSEGGIECGGK